MAPLRALLDELLLPWSVPNHNVRDPRLKSEMEFHLGYWLDRHPNAVTYVFQMRPDIRATYRSNASQPGRPPTINPHSDGSLGIRADRNVKCQDAISVQVAYYDALYMNRDQTEQIGSDLYGLSFNLGVVPIDIFEVLS